MGPVAGHGTSHGRAWVAHGRLQQRFQVVDADVNMHPHMDASFCLYNLEQARSMLDDDNQGDEQWELLAIWTGEVEEPTFMFELGELRDVNSSF